MQNTGNKKLQQKETKQKQSQRKNNKINGKTALQILINKTGLKFVITEKV